MGHAGVGRVVSPVLVWLDLFIFNIEHIKLSSIESLTFSARILDKLILTTGEAARLPGASLYQIILLSNAMQLTIPGPEADFTQPSDKCIYICSEKRTIQLDSIQFLLEHNGSVFQRYGRNVRKYSTLSYCNNQLARTMQIKQPSQPVG